MELMGERHKIVETKKAAMKVKGLDVFKNKLSNRKSPKTPKREKSRSDPKTGPKTPILTPVRKHQKRGQKHQILAFPGI